MKTNNRRDIEVDVHDLYSVQMNQKHNSSSTVVNHEIHSVYPGDLYPFLRKPLFLIVDSNNSNAFQNMPNLFGQPLVILLSPVKLPNHFQSEEKFKSFPLL